MKRTLFIAEAGVNHNGDMKIARQLIDAAADAGADIVKFQTFSAKQLATRNAQKAEYQKSNTLTVESQFEMLAKLELPPKEHFGLKEYAEGRGIEFLSSPFDLESARFLASDLKLKRIKIPSGEITNAQLLLTVARTGMQVVLSTGMCDLTDVESALGVLAYGYSSTDSQPSRAAFKAAYVSKDDYDRFSRR